MNLNFISDKIVFESLNLIKHGNMELINYDNKKFSFGNSNENALFFKCLQEIFEKQRYFQKE